jgi:hypothetical protein
VIQPINDPDYETRRGLAGSFGATAMTYSNAEGPTNNEKERGAARKKGRGGGGRGGRGPSSPRTKYKPFPVFPRLRSEKKQKQKQKTQETFRPPNPAPP